MDGAALVRPKDRLATNRLGAYAEAKVLERAVEKGIDVYKPVFECRVDFVLDDGLKLYRTQVKYAGGSSPKQCQGGRAARAAEVAERRTGGHPVLHGRGNRSSVGLRPED